MPPSTPTPPRRGHGGVVLWDARRGTRLQAGPMAVPEGHVSSLTFSPDGDTLSASYFVVRTRRAPAFGVVLWDARRGTRVQAGPMTVAEGHVSSLAFSPDGDTLAASYSVSGQGVRSKGGVVLWDARRGVRLQAEPLTVAEGRVSSMAFSPDGMTVAAIYYDDRVGGTGVVFWDVDLDSWMRRAGQIANRNLSLKEWRRFFPDEPYRKTFDKLQNLPMRSRTTHTYLRSEGGRAEENLGVN